MTDLDIFLLFYKRAGIELTPVDDSHGDSIVFRFGKDRYGDNDVVDSNKFDGYPGFYSDVEFTKEGEFIRQGFWE